MRLPRTVRLFFKRLSYGGIGGTAEGARVVSWIEPKSGMKVADIGSGFGDFAFRFAGAVGPGGVVYAVDTDADLRLEVAKRARARGLPQVKTVEAVVDSPGLPEQVDLVFLSSSFHHLPSQVPYFQDMAASIRPAGRVVILEGKPSPVSKVFGHATPPETVRATMEQAGYRWVASADFVRWQSLQSFETTTPG